MGQWMKWLVKMVDLVSTKILSVSQIVAEIQVDVGALSSQKITIPKNFQAARTMEFFLEGAKREIFY